MGRVTVGSSGVVADDDVILPYTNTVSIGASATAMYARLLDSKLRGLAVERLLPSFFTLETTVTGNENMKVSLLK